MKRGITLIILLLLLSNCAPAGGLVVTPLATPIDLILGELQKSEGYTYAPVITESIRVWNCDNPLPRSDIITEIKAIDRTIDWQIHQEVGAEVGAGVIVANASVEAAIGTGYRLETSDWMERGRSIEMPVGAHSSAEYVVEWKPVVWSGYLPWEMQSAAGRIEYEYGRIAFGAVVDYIDRTAEECGVTFAPPSLTPIVIDTPGPAEPRPIALQGQLLLTLRTPEDIGVYIYDLQQNTLIPLTKGSAAEDRAAHWSPDGQKIIFTSNRDGSDQLFVMDANGSNVWRLTNGQGYACCADWSPDGGHIVFNANGVDGPQDIYRIRVDGTNQVNLTLTPYEDWTPKFSPSGMQIAYYSQPSGNNDVMVMNFDGTEKDQLTQNAYADRNPTWSPDGQKMSFFSDRDGNYEIYAMNNDGTALRNLTNHSAGDRWPVWSPDGSHIAFTSSRDGADGIFVMDANGENVTLVAEFVGNAVVSDWK